VHAQMRYLQQEGALSKIHLFSLGKHVSIRAREGSLRVAFLPMGDAGTYQGCCPLNVPALSTSP
jgi:hypothetical protein